MSESPDVGETLKGKNMNLTLAELIRLSDALANKLDYMVQNGDGTDPYQNIDYAKYKALFKKVNDEYSDRVTAIYDIHTPLKGE
tara:strand:- start:38 stop:289 length:252 start_codon:yes stop_codon:yes gene_type:complete